MKAWIGWIQNRFLQSALVETNNPYLLKILSCTKCISMICCFSWHVVSKSFFIKSTKRHFHIYHTLPPAFPAVKNGILGISNGRNFNPTNPHEILELKIFLGKGVEIEIHGSCAQSRDCLEESFGQKFQPVYNAACPPHNCTTLFIKWQSKWPNMMTVILSFRRRKKRGVSREVW